MDDRQDMQSFVLRQNIARYEQVLNTRSDPAVRISMQMLLADARRELALLESAELGSLPLHYRNEDQFDGLMTRDLLYDVFLRSFNDSANLYLVIDPGPGLSIAEANDAYCAATLTVRSQITGRPLFEVFPDNPADRGADGVSNLFRSIRTAFQARRPHEMEIQRYDVRDRAGIFQERYWRPINSPLFDHDGTVKYILHHVMDVTDQRSSI